MIDKRAAAALRQRRYKKHSTGDHSLCLPTNCDGAGNRPTPVTPRKQQKPRPQRPVAPAEHPEQPYNAPEAPEIVVEGRGAQVWAAMEAQMPSAAHRVLLQEVCRSADRLDRLDAMLTGRSTEWLRPAVEDLTGDGEVKVRVVVDSALTEVRQQQSVLKSMLAELRNAAPAAHKASAPAETPAEPVKGGGGLADLTARIADRRRQTTG